MFFVLYIYLPHCVCFVLGEGCKQIAITCAQSRAIIYRQYLCLSYARRCYMTFFYLETGLNKTRMYD